LGSSYVYEGIRDDLPRILKIVPGVYNTDQILAGGTEDQLLGEIEFVLYLAEHGVQLAMPLPSCLGNWVECIPVTDHYCFLVYCFEKAPGYMYPDQNEVYFPEHVLTEWGRMHAVLHNLAEGFQPSEPRYRRLDWDQDDRLAYWSLIPVEQTLVCQRYAEIMEQLQALPRTSQVYGLTHGDFHHGNFFVENNQIILFDFDAAQYFWYPGEISIPLYNCLPLPHSETARRRTVSLKFLSHFLKGYRKERYLDSDWLEILPLFLKFQEIVDYAYRHKYWDLSNLTERQKQVLQEFQVRIEENIPVVSFEEGDLQKLYQHTGFGG
jgi:Ser/Thr protein kinase RdoA (MazF antagonist)